MTRTTFGAIALALAATGIGQGRGPSGRWLGQDGHDVVGPSSAPGGSDVQDIHIALKGLPAGKGVKDGVVKGLGGDEWAIHGPFGPWKAELVRKEGATTADLYLEPTRVETGRPFSVHLQFDDGTTADFDVDGGKADPDRRMPSAALRARWLGQDGPDRVGPDAAVGPDGIKDVHIELSGLSPKVEARSVAITGPGRLAWESGLNPKGLADAELIRRADDPKKADLYLNPIGDLKGKSLILRVSYANNKSDTATVVAGQTNPELAAAKVPLPTFAKLPIRARWEGQDDRGEVRLTVESLPRGRGVVAAVLGDGVQGAWVFRSRSDLLPDVEPYARPLSFERAADPTRAVLRFAPIRDMAKSTPTLRLVFDDDTSALVRLAGGPCDPERMAPALAPETHQARPGDDLAAIVARGGTVRLAAGKYPLRRPLVLERPVRIVGEAGAILEFTQESGDPPWSAAIKVHAGRTTLEGFAVRFAGPVRWARDVDHGPAVIGSTDNRDPAHNDPEVGITLRRLDLESPPVSGPAEEAPRLIRLATATCGRIESNRLKGGMIELVGGPWRVVDNQYLGTVPGTFCFGVLGVHRTHDLVVAGNRARPVAPAGKTWRFLVLTESGSHDIIKDNEVVGIGPRDDDPGPNANAPEIVLTEAYSLHFEGRPSALSADGRLVAIPEPQGGPARGGDVVAVVAGPAAGHWSRIVQAIGPRVYLVDPPLPGRGVEAVAIATGFVDETFEGNTIDARGGSVAAPLVLVGNHYGTVVRANRLFGGGEAFRLTAAPTERPVAWGWSHAPFLGARIESNTLEDSARGGTVAVEHSPAIKSSRGRVYLTATLKGNTARWSDPFRARQTGPLTALTLGEPGAPDPGELVVTEEGNRVDGIGVPVRVRSGRVNGKAVASGSARTTGRAR
ncbi:MAG TPA: hypothetical protein VG406_29085 [Isosphaeraceae bacterium]|jgi:hypothetical protein|nr:hypothetical protein [Isosphaeraceae bacterium]